MYWLLAIFLISNFPYLNGHVAWNFNGSTPGFKNIVLGRCNEYSALNMNNRMKDLHINFECTEFWKNFSDIFAYKDSCKTNLNYDDLIENIDNKLDITDKVMFWSGSKGVVHKFTNINSQYITLEDTFPGYIADGLMWCGCTGKDCNQTEGIDTVYCNKSCDATKNYWTGISEQLARKANGKAYVMLNGTTEGYFTAYYNESIFGKNEFPAIGAEKKVSMLTVYLIHDLDVEPKEKCGTGSLIKMEEDAKKYGVNMTCIDDPIMVNDMLCAIYPEAKECLKRFEKEEDKDKSTWKDAGIALIAICGVLLLCVVVLLIMYKRTATKYGEFSNEERA